MNAARSVLEGTAPPPAAANSVLAETCLFVLRELGLSRAVGGVVLDDAPCMQLVESRLTVVVQPIEEPAEAVPSPRHLSYMSRIGRRCNQWCWSRG
jgi:DNA-binding LacI/PurR family transcriptional regulator